MTDISPQEKLLNEMEEQGNLVPTIDLGARQLKRQALDSLFARAMAGLIPRPRQLKAWEPELLDERHLHAILLRAGGMQQGQIAKMLNWSESWTSVVLNHPDAQYVLTRIVSFAADNVIDMETRIKAHAPEALDTIVEVMRESKDEKVRSTNAFELLKMAGYGSKKPEAPTINAQNVQINQGVPEKALTNLADAIRESRQIQEVIYSMPAGSGPLAVPTVTSGPLGDQGNGAPPTIGSADSDLADLESIDREERVA